MDAVIIFFFWIVSGIFNYGWMKRKMKRKKIWEDNRYFILPGLFFSFILGPVLTLAFLLEWSFDEN